MSEQNDELGLNVTKPVSVWHRAVKANFKDLFKAVSKAGLNASLGKPGVKWLLVAKDLVDAVTSLGLESKSPGELAWALIYNSLKRAIARLAVDSQGFMPAVPEDFEAYCDKLRFDRVDEVELTIGPDFFEHPERLRLLKPLQEPLAEWFVGFGAEELQAETLAQRLPTYFVFELYQEWRRHTSEYAPILAAVETPFTRAAERERGWRLYQAWLEKQVCEPMLLEAFGLEDVYVDPYAYYRCKVKGEGARERGDLREGQEQWERTVVSLDADLQKWLQTADRDDAIRVVSGGPGSGKSSFAKMLAARHGERFGFPVLFVPLHQFDLTGDVVQSIGDFVRFQEYIAGNPLDPEKAHPRLLIIFDGLDELAKQGKLSEGIAREFVRDLEVKVELFNQSDTRLVQVLLTGRDVAVQTACPRNPERIYYMLPYFTLEGRRDEDDGEEYVKGGDLLEEDLRNTWWQKYGVVTRKDYEGMPTELNRENLEEITGQPLLNYLVALTYADGSLNLSDATTLNSIYADLLHKV